MRGSNVLENRHVARRALSMALSLSKNPLAGTMKQKIGFLVDAVVSLGKRLEPDE